MEIESIVLFCRKVKLWKKALMRSENILTKIRCTTMNITTTTQPKTAQAYFTLNGFVQSSLTLSALGSLLIISFMIITRKYKIFVQKLVLSVAINTFLYSSIPLMTSFYNMTDTSAVCIAHAMTTHYFGLTLLLWIFVITIYLFMCVYNFGSFLSRYFFSVVCPLVLLPPLAPTVYLFVGNYYGPAGIWCWVKKEYTGFRFGTYYIPLFTIIGSEIFLYVLIIAKVYTMTKPQARDTNLDNQNKKQYREEVKPLLFFPMVYVCLLLPISIIRVSEAVNPIYKPGIALAILSAFCTKNTGFVNSVVYLGFLTDKKELSPTNLWRSVKTMFCCHPDHVEHGIETFSHTRATTTRSDS